MDDLRPRPRLAVVGRLHKLDATEGAHMGFAAPGISEDELAVLSSGNGCPAVVAMREVTDGADRFERFGLELVRGASREGQGETGAGGEQEFSARQSGRLDHPLDSISSDGWRQARNLSGENRFYWSVDERLD